MQPDFGEAKAKKEATWKLQSRYQAWCRRWAAANELEAGAPRKEVRMMEARTNMDQAALEIRQAGGLK